MNCIAPVRKTFGILAVTVALLAHGCSDDPSAIGIGLINESTTVDSIVIEASESHTYRAPITGNSDNLLLGRSGGFQSWLLLQFGPFSATLNDSLVARAEVRLRTRYWFPDSSGVLAFTAHRINQDWSQDTVRFEDAQSLYDETPVFGTFLNSVSPRDSIITVTLDTALVRDWIRAAPAVAGGVLFRPTLGSTIIFGFRSDFFLRVHPELWIYYDHPDTNLQDTLRFSARKDAFVAMGPQPPSSPELMFVQAGISDRGFVKFNLDALPARASMTSATMEFTRNNSLSIRNEHTNDAILVQLLLNDATPPLGETFVAARPVREDDSVYAADLRIITQRWVGGQPNFGLALRAANEFSSFDRFAIYGVGAQDKPKLKIKYTILQP